eukprot:CAMPEP_0171242524 /NCGR_PEP_ID=MMETSP0790-20130122/45748_1 /TAXON_ID=2925 /ORGANISM="Alexandrium catenella, Strain OF101" /LENGTH=83 /DNA_ID=CAMNT_0011709353 /DNA_START=508 /DNA_END=756 /DNA_ORIENTATION=-
MVIALLVGRSMITPWDATTLGSMRSPAPLAFVVQQALKLTVDGEVTALMRCRKRPRANSKEHREDPAGGTGAIDVGGDCCGLP